MSEMFCFLIGHKYDIELQFAGHSGAVRIVSCKRCNKRWIMSDAHKAFLRYDNDPTMIEDLKEIYPQVRNWM